MKKNLLPVLLLSALSTQAFAVDALWISRSPSKKGGLSVVPGLTKNGVRAAFIWNEEADYNDYSRFYRENEKTTLVMRAYNFTTSKLDTSEFEFLRKHNHQMKPSGVYTGTHSFIAYTHDNSVYNQYSNSSRRVGDLDIGLVRYRGFFNSADLPWTITKDHSSYRYAKSERSPSLAYQERTNQLVLVNTVGEYQSTGYGRGRIQDDFYDQDIELRILDSYDGRVISKMLLTDRSERGWESNPKVTLTSDQYAVVVYETYAHGSQKSLQAKVVDISNQRSPRIVDEFSVPNSYGAQNPSLTVRNGKMFLAFESSDENIQVYVYDTQSLRLERTFDLRGYAESKRYWFKDRNFYSPVLFEVNPDEFVRRGKKELWLGFLFDADYNGRRYGRDKTDVFAIKIEE